MLFGLLSWRGESSVEESEENEWERGKVRRVGFDDEGAGGERLMPLREELENVRGSEEGSFDFRLW